MKASWTKGLSVDQRNEVMAEFRASAAFRQMLIELLTDKIDEQLRFARGKERYDNPNWPFLQADACGYNRAIQDIISLLE